MVDLKSDLATIVLAGKILDAPDILESYASDQSFANAIQPQLVVEPGNADEVQKMVVWANRTKTPLVPVSSGPPHFHGDTVPGVPGAIIVDLSGMKQILKIDRRNRVAIIKPGVTYRELQSALAEENLRISMPLMPRGNKSVLASLLEREPRLNCRYQWSSLDPLRCCGIIFGDGNRLMSGGSGAYLSAESGDEGTEEHIIEELCKQEKWPLDPSGPGQVDFYRLLSAAQGSIGIAMWASVRCEVLPVIHKFFFVAAKKIEELTDFTSRLLRFRYADELFIMNGATMAGALTGNPRDINALRDQLPPWMVIVGIAGRQELPEERVEYQEKDIADFAREFGLELKEAVPGADGAQVGKVITSPSREPYWKLGCKGGSQEIFFVTTLDRVSDLSAAMYSVAEKSGYPTGDIGIYLQPRHQGVNCHCEFILPYNPDNEDEVSRIKSLYLSASTELLDRGAFFTRPYGIWADMAFKKDEQTARLLKNMKNAFDPRGVMNPGKLCFKVS